MKITIKAKGKDPENNEEELQKKQQLEELQRAEAEKELAAKAKQAQIDSLLEHFEKEAADSPELIKDKDSYFNSKEFNDLSIENFDFNKKRRAELEDRVVHLEDVYEQEKKKSKNTIPWRNYLVYLMIITSLSCCVSFSKYITEVSGGGAGTVAKFDVKVNLLNKDGTLAREYDAETIDFTGGGTVVGRKFTTKGENEYYWLQIINNSDVTVRVNLSYSLATEGTLLHPIKFFSDSSEENEITYIDISAGAKDDVFLFCYAAEKSITEQIYIDMDIEQLD